MAVTSDTSMLVVPRGLRHDRESSIHEALLLRMEQARATQGLQLSESESGSELVFVDGVVRCPAEAPHHLLAA